MFIALDAWVRSVQGAGSDVVLSAYEDYSLELADASEGYSERTFFEDERSPNCGIVRTLHQQAKRADLWYQHEADP